MIRNHMPHLMPKHSSDPGVIFNIVHQSFMHSNICAASNEGIEVVLWQQYYLPILISIVTNLMHFFKYLLQSCVGIPIYLSIQG